MTSKNIFRQYFKRKLIIWIGIGVVATMIRLIGGHETSFVFIVTILLSFTLAALINGYIDYRFYEKSAPKIITRLLDGEPLLDFQKNGFVKEEGGRLEGTINNYKIILLPFVNMQNNRFLTVIIPLQIKEGLDGYFRKYNGNFKFRLSGEIIFAEAVIKDYDKEYGYNKLLDLIDMTTISLRENKIEPINIVGD